MFAKETLDVFDTDAWLLALEITSSLKIGVGNKVHCSSFLMRYEIQ